MHPVNECWRKSPIVPQTGGYEHAQSTTVRCEIHFPIPGLMNMSLPKYVPKYESVKLI